MTEILKKKPTDASNRIKIVLVAVFFCVVAGSAWLYGQLQGSLPQLAGQQVLPGLSAPVMVERDGLGIPTIHADNRLDVAQALGFLHGQERFFQMDLLRRHAAGELAELGGASIVAMDKAVRVHQFRRRAQQLFAQLPVFDQDLVKRYTAGVNAGLQALAVVPFEYLLLQQTPVPWQPEDTLLTIDAMYQMLQGDQGRRELIYGALHDTLPLPLYQFLTPLGTSWDAPLLGEPLASPPIPDATVVDIRQRPSFQRFGWDEAFEAHIERGSNSWAVAGTHSRHGGALVANDMHLLLSVPNIWYRAAWVYPLPSDPRQYRRIVGITLPGVPNVVIGSTGDLAWGFTNSQGDWSDLITLEISADGRQYRTVEGWQPFHIEIETIQVRAAAPQALEVRLTPWGPVIERDHLGRAVVQRWVAHDPQSINFTMTHLETVKTVEEAVAIAHLSSIPTQNVVFADAQGHIAWTLMGPVPNRFGHDGRLPRSWQDWAEGRIGWDGFLESEAIPVLINPPSGRLWTANARVVDGEWLERIGDNGYALGARAQQIRDALQSLDKASEGDFLALQLDSRALFLNRWQALLLSVLTPEALKADPRRQALHEVVQTWNGKASVDSVGFRMVRAFRALVAQRAFAPLIAPCQQADARCDYTWVRQREGPLWALVSQRPLHLLDRGYASWDDFLLAAADTLIEHFTRDGKTFADHPWGAYNQVRIHHPLSRVLPWLSPWLDMPTQGLPGDTYMPRVQGHQDGASQRMVVSPGHEDRGIFHMPTGQSGHPLSRHYRDSHSAWVAGEPSPFLPGVTEHRLQLIPLSPPAPSTPTVSTSSSQPATRSTWITPDAEGQPLIHLYFFWSHTCPHCQDAKPFLETLQKTTPWLQLHSLEILNHTENRQRYIELATALGQTAQSVPAFLFCGQMTVGWHQAPTTGRALRDRLQACHQAALSGEVFPTVLPAAPPLHIPFIGTLDTAAWSLPMLTILMAGMDAFNPCAFFVLLFLLSLLAHQKQRQRMLLIGGIFVLFSGVMYFVFMAAWLNLFQWLGHLAWITVAAGGIAVMVGLINIKDFFAIHQGVSLSIPESRKPDLFRRSRAILSANYLPTLIGATIVLAIAANFYELLCTAGFPMVYTRLLTLQITDPFVHYLYLALYNVIYVLPLLLIVLVFVGTLGAHKLTEWEGRLLKLLSGLIMFGLGILLLWAPDWISQLPMTAGLMAGAVGITLLAAWLGPKTART